MSCNKKLGGYTKIVYGTTTGLTTSTEITGLWSGTNAGTGEASIQQDAAGNDINTGVRHRIEIQTTSVTAAFITNLSNAMKNCTDLYFRFYATGAKRIKVGAVRISEMTVQGAAPGEVHRYVIRATAFVEETVDVVTFES